MFVGTLFSMTPPKIIHSATSLRWRTSSQYCYSRLLPVQLCTCQTPFKRSSSSSSILTTRASTQSSTSLAGSLSISPYTTSHPETFHDALRAKQRALCLLKSALENMASVDVDVTLAVVLLLIRFELIDSGRGRWIFHINGARSIIEKMIAFGLETATALSPLRS